MPDETTSQDLLDGRNAARFTQADIDEHQIGTVSSCGSDGVSTIGLNSADDITELLERFGKRLADHVCGLIVTQPHDLSPGGHKRPCTHDDQGLHGAPTRLRQQ